MSCQRIRPRTAFGPTGPEAGHGRLPQQLRREKGCSGAGMTRNARRTHVGQSAPCDALRGMAGRLAAIAGRGRFPQQSLLRRRAGVDSRHAAGPDRRQHRLAQGTTKQEKVSGTNGTAACRARSCGDGRGRDAVPASRRPAPHVGKRRKTPSLLPGERSKTPSLLPVARTRSFGRFLSEARGWIWPN